jgi:hypothetical protein
LSSLAGLAVTLGEANETKIEETASAALRRLADQRAVWLLVYDNVPAPGSDLFARNGGAGYRGHAGRQLQTPARSVGWPRRPALPGGQFQILQYGRATAGELFGVA